MKTNAYQGFRKNIYENEKARVLFQESSARDCNVVIKAAGHGQLETGGYR